MHTNFARCLELVLEHEGGFVNHKKDPGGPTNFGVTQKVYDAYRKTRARPYQSVKFISDDEVQQIYRFQYWDRVQGDMLPIGLDYAVFDYAVNSGVARASKHLQDCVGTKPDGVIGAMTIAAIGKPANVINALCDRRMSFLRNLPTFLTFGKGWTRRVEGVNPKKVDGVREVALEMAS